ncbi:cytidylyltransferase domain-containing protein [uncultured Cohaesibacter sp.]|uniref:cytidylyltransferase domain-containing protein n=1 Tax=uncultured Cohaesibacter sp. TaxID=1002546 RepID=UPI0029314554|nr:NTP transferase domain-containing protein [uncultured Cohaesibacter sp.]
MKPLIVIQCRLSSSRLPAKALLDLGGASLLQRVVERCQMVQSPSDIVIATSTNPEDAMIADHATRLGVKSFRGSLEDVRQRFIDCASEFGSDCVIRVTADNPYTEPAFIDDMIKAKMANPSCPYIVHDLDKVVYGTAGELIDMKALTNNLSSLPGIGKEHTTSGLAQLPGAIKLVPSAPLSDENLSLTVDNLDQFHKVWAIMKTFGNGKDALAKIVASFKASDHPSLQFPVRSQ